MKVFVLIFLTLLTACSVQQAKVASPTPTPIPLIPVMEDQIPKPPIEEEEIQLPETDRNKDAVAKKLEDYFDRREIKPSLIIENDYDGARKERVEEIKVSNHKITWFHSLEASELKIDDDLITLEDKSSLNNPNGSDKINGKIVNNWDKIKLFNVKGRKLIGIEIRHDFCTGLMCSVTFFLVYDLKTKSSNFFGDFRIDKEVRLYDFGKNRTIDFLSTTNDFTYTPGFEITHIYNFYTLDKKGVFRLQKDNRRKPFFIKRVFSSDNDEEFENKFEQSWIEKIK